MDSRAFEATPPQVAGRPGRVLVVDDHPTSRLKMAAAVAARGHTVSTAGDGETALQMLAENGIDLVLLDIVMPGMDGFTVLQRIKSDRRLRDIPVIVISALDDDMASVVKAIEGGAEDFLPKSFEPTLLRARLETCLEKKRLRDAEVEYLGEVAKLTHAARVLEKGKFNPEKLGISEVTGRGDALGALAKVFTAMAQEVYERERRLRRNVRTANGTLLLLACGALWGATVPLSKLAANIAPHPVGLALLVGVIAALICLSLAIGRNAFPSPRSLKQADWTFIIIAAFLGSVVNQVLMYWMTSRLPAFLVVIVIVLEGFAVFVLSAFLKIEKPTTKRLIGLCLGLAGVFAIIWIREKSTGESAWFWMLVALAIPLTYAVEDIYISLRRPAHLDITALNAYVYGVSALMVAPIALVLGDLIPIELLIGPLGLYVLGLAAVTSIAMILFVRLIATAGPVFAGQNAYAVTAAGICWSILLVNEHIALGIWMALAIIVIGLLLVGPQQEADPEPPAIDAPERALSGGLG
jgi:DNA-binding response OmpR family regulator/drug/metabolite transporter (DMT)-like permease